MSCTRQSSCCLYFPANIVCMSSTSIFRWGRLASDRINGTARFRTQNLLQRIRRRGKLENERWESVHRFQFRMCHVYLFSFFVLLGNRNNFDKILDSIAELNLLNPKIELWVIKNVVGIKYNKVFSKKQC